MNRLLSLCTIMICFAMTQSYGQLEYGKYLVDTLCHEDMHGRGYYKKGDSIAAEFLSEEFKKLGVKKFEATHDYHQSFKLPVNSIDGNVKVAIRKKTLTPGQDYLVSPASPPIKGNFEVHVLDTALIGDRLGIIGAIKKAKGKFLVVHKDNYSDQRAINGLIQALHREKGLPIAGVIAVSSNNLIYTASQTKAERPLIEIDNRQFTGTIDKKIEVLIESTHTDDYQSQNVLGYIEGTEKDSFVCISAHYDHLGRMGHEIYFPGANDNASGTAMLLALAKHFSKEKPKYSIAFFAFGAEEIGLVGSKHYVENPMFPLENIKFLLNLDILGTGDDGIQIVNSAIYEDHYKKMKTINTLHHLLKQVKVRGERCNSDHCFFHERGVPSFFIYTLGGIAHYHNIYDISKTLPLTEFEDLHKLLVEFIGEL